MNKCNHNLKLISIISPSGVDSIFASVGLFQCIKCKLIEAGGIIRNKNYNIFKLKNSLKYKGKEYDL